MESLWSKQTGQIHGQKIRDSKETHRDVIVIGAGMAGILTAFYLKEQGLEVLVLEANRIASGQTRGTTAKITCQHDLKYSKLITDVGLNKARMYARANEEAINEYERLIEENKIECDFMRVPSYLYTLENEKLLYREMQAAVNLGIDVHFTKKTELPFQIKGAICFPNQAQFSPLKFIRQLASQLEILEYTRVMDIKGKRVITEESVFTADKIVMATHYPIINRMGYYFLRQHQERSYVLALSGCPKINGMYYGVDSNGLSFRQAGDKLLFGGASHRTGNSHKGGTYCFLRKEAEKIYPKSKEEMCWAAQDCMPHDGIPFIGKYSVFNPNLYVITGFQKWGMTSSMIAAMIMRDKICGIEYPYEKVFSPQRINFIAGIQNLLADIGVSAKGLTKGFLGEKTKRCPHLGCELKWNEEEQSFDCPCHGSRFAKDGKLIDNPAKTDKECSDY